MKELRWNEQKNEWLKKTRGTSFEDLLLGKLIAIKRHPKLAHQHLMLFEYKDYLWVVPFVVSGDIVFLKTLYPSRKYTQVFKGGE